mmetsp:Transcript_35764/g.83170  ORF Transcript_35764/g.83170 Transcript_35764/m.83170 type:complete len:214 (+) Transcript_35764:73-714(+)
MPPNSEKHLLLHLPSSDLRLLCWLGRFRTEGLLRPSAQLGQAGRWCRTRTVVGCTPYRVVVLPCMVRGVEGELDTARFTAVRRGNFDQRVQQTCGLAASLGGTVDDGINSSKACEGLRLYVAAPSCWLSHSFAILIEVLFKERFEVLAVVPHEVNAALTELRVRLTTIAVELVCKRTEETRAVGLHLLDPEVTSFQKLLVTAQCSLPALLCTV